MDAYQRFPKKWRTLGVRWPNRHGVTAPSPAFTSVHRLSPAFINFQQLLPTFTNVCQYVGKRRPKRYSVNPPLDVVSLHNVVTT